MYVYIRVYIYICARLALKCIKDRCGQTSVKRKRETSTEATYRDAIISGAVVAAMAAVATLIGGMVCQLAITFGI